MKQATNRPCEVTANMIPDFGVSFFEEDLRKGAAVDLLASLRPAWPQSSVKIKARPWNELLAREGLDLRPHVFTEGITNKLIGFYHPEDPDDIVLFRIYGKNTDLIIDRNAELNTMKMFASFGCAPPLYATFSNGFCYGFVPGETLDEFSVRDQVVQRLVVEAFVRIHRLCLGKNSADNQPVLFPVLKRYLALIPTSFSDTLQQNKFEKCIPSRAVLSNELQVLESHLSSVQSPILFCHNDVLLKNVIYDKHKAKTLLNQDSLKKPFKVSLRLSRTVSDLVSFIDYEYAGFNYQAFDIGNHFCEFAGVQDMDFSHYPDRKFQLKWLRSYLECWHRAESTGEISVSDVEVDRLYVQVNKFALASHFLWGVWGLVQASYSTIDFDYLSFASARLNEYFARKEEFMNLELPEL